jgi:hypothetical protein
MPKKNFFKVIINPSIGGRILMILAILGVLAIAILLSGPKLIDVSDQPSTGHYVPTQTSDDYLQLPGITNTKSASEYPVTLGIIAGAAAILLIIEIGTLIELRHPD